MRSIAHKRRESRLFQEMASIVSERLENTNIALATVTSVKLSGDQSVLKVYITFAQHPSRSLVHLKRATGFIRSQLAKVGGLRKVPELVFELDDVFATATRIDRIISKLKNSKDSKQE